MLKTPTRRFKEQVSAACQLGQRSYNLQLPYYPHETRVDNSAVSCNAHHLLRNRVIRGFQGGDYEQCGLLGCDAALSAVSVRSFLRNGFLRKFDNFYQNIQHNIQDEGNLPVCMTCFKYVGLQESKGRLFIALA